ncbi:hypothetical protein BABINDRAFT_162312 [Babjeviella inositovora NRRL Y-12698]|uniref:DUF962 domain protein n=1 Tax=Babjeviella inositovora NRRL Y-12698 TaxID=984486 RepID=A0A1E3QNL7_9ASCO|nr:uncharacterized protein BABINDRAFT_162312 [Babjeviella inositovora NRRL Y-12698]ODQ79283.1 hypothetical protein BABINDRAFT_162312 [Babjeviella inositovora NRRL Y-12698]
MAILILEDQLAFYRAYHFNKINVAIHAIGVPLILLSTIVAALAVPLPFFNNPYLNLGSASALGYGVFYCLLDPLGYVALPLLASVAYFTVNTLFAEFPVALVVKTALGISAAGWVAQFIGHGVFEKRAPALFDNLVQALVLAPFFILFELVFAAGFRRDLKKKMDNKAGVLVRDFRVGKKVQ